MTPRLVGSEMCIRDSVHARTHPCLFAFVWSYLRVNVDRLPLSLHRQVQHLILFVHQWRRVLPTNKTHYPSHAKREHGQHCQGVSSTQVTLSRGVIYTGNTVKGCHLPSWHRWQLKLCSLYPLYPLIHPPPHPNIFTTTYNCVSLHRHK